MNALELQFDDPGAAFPLPADFMAVETELSALRRRVEQLEREVGRLQMELSAARVQPITHP